MTLAGKTSQDDKTSACRKAEVDQAWKAVQRTRVGDAGRQTLESDEDLRAGLHDDWAGMS